MIYAIIEAASDVEELITVAYGEKASDVAAWFVDEVRDTAEMYLSEPSDFEKLDEVCGSLSVLCDEDADTGTDDLDGVYVEVGGITVSLVGAFDGYAAMKTALTVYLSEKPKFKKLTIPDNPSEDTAVTDTLNAALIRCGL